MIMSDNCWIKRKTTRIRYSFVKQITKVLTPTLYGNLMLAYNRGMVCYLKKVHGSSQLVGVEVGVYQGTNAYHMLTTLNLKTLYLIDPYLPYEDGDGTTRDCGDNDFSIAKRDLNKFSSRCIFIRKTSLDAIKDLPDNLDFVYIDANHNYKYVKVDIEAYYKKICVGGVLGGHDFYEQYQGVIFAVTDFAREHNLRLFIDSPDWWVIKV
jgi:hypothetical protein